MAEELYDTLLRFHREVVVPDIERIVEERLHSRITPLRDEMLAGFDHIYNQLNVLSDEYQALRAGVQRIEDRLTSMESRLTAVEGKIDRLALRSELVVLKEELAQIEERIAKLEAAIAR